MVTCRIIGHKPVERVIPVERGGISVKYCSRCLKLLTPLEPPSEDPKYLALDPTTGRIWLTLLGIKDVGYSTPDDFATLLQSLSDDEAAGRTYMFSDALDYFTDIVSSANITVDKVASIFNSSTILAHACAQILNNARLSISRAAQILNSANITTSKAADILNDPGITSNRVHSILSDANIAADRVQAILYAMADGLYIDKLLDILTVTASDAVISANTTITGINRYRTLTVNSGITLTVGGQPGVIIAYKLTNNGTITKTATGGAGGSPFVSPGAGGAGGGGLIIVAGEVHYGTYNAGGAAGENGATTTASGSGTAGGGGAMIRVGTDVAGNGGKGGGFSTYLGGAGGTVTLTTIDSYSTVFKEVLKQAVDRYIVNVLGKTPTATKSFYNVYGAGGGGGGDYDTGADCGGGGGSGGQILTVTGVIDGGTFSVVGGKGGDGGAEGAYDVGGDGGGGGIAYVLYRSLITAPTFNASGGAGGAGDINGSSGAAGTGKSVAI